MPLELLHAIFANLWSTFLVLVFFGGSIFVHELGHFLAARWRGVRVERFSIGFGPALWSRRGRDGVEYRISWIPLGGYVALPQLADLSAIEGRPSAEAARLPPVDYFSKLIVFVAGALFNVLFAFLLACVIWGVGQPERDDLATTRIGYVLPTVELPGGVKVPSPAVEAGLRVGDVILSIDGRAVHDWNDVMMATQLGSGRTASGAPFLSMAVERDGKRLRLPVYPRLTGEDRSRQIGIDHSTELVVYEAAPGSPAARAGFRPGDRLIRFDGRKIFSLDALADELDATRAQAVQAVVERAGAEAVLTLPPRPVAKPGDEIGLSFVAGYHLTHPSPFQQIGDQFAVTFRSLWSLINPRSNIGLSKVSGPVGIVHYLIDAADVGLPVVLMLVVLINVNLAIINLLPIPVLDGGWILFATISRLRGRALPVSFVATAQSLFIALILGMVLYVSVFNVRDWVHDVQMEKLANGK